MIGETCTEVEEPLQHRCGNGLKLDVQTVEDAQDAYPLITCRIFQLLVDTVAFLDVDTGCFCDVADIQRF